MRSIVLLLIASVVNAQWVGNSSAVSIPAPNPPGRMTKYNDPTFGTPMYQVTDETDGYCRHEYSTQPAFSLGSGNFVINCNGVLRLYSMNPDTFVISGYTSLPAQVAQWRGDSWTWSERDANIAWGTYYTKFQRYNFGTSTRDDLLDLPTVFPQYNIAIVDGGSLTASRVTASYSGTRFAFVLQSSNGQPLGIVVYDFDLNKIVFETPFVRRGEYFKIQMDRTGRYLTNIRQYGTPSGSPECEINGDLWDITTGEHRVTTRGDASACGLSNYRSYTPGHGDWGSGHWVGEQESLYGQYYKMPFSMGPFSKTNLMPTLSGLFISSGHFSVREVSDTWAAASRGPAYSLIRDNGCVQPTPTVAYQGEIILLPLDGSGAAAHAGIRRIAHQQSNACSGDYWQFARPVISPDGRYVMWNADAAAAVSSRTMIFVAATGVNTTGATIKQVNQGQRMYFSAQTGKTSAAQSFILKNWGNVTVNISSVALGGTDTSSFAISSNGCGATLAAGASCTVQVTFSPATVGEKNARLNIVTDAAGEDLSMALIGSPAGTKVTGKRVSGRVAIQ